MIKACIVYYRYEVVKPLNTPPLHQQPGQEESQSGRRLKAISWSAVGTTHTHTDKTCRPHWCKRSSFYGDNVRAAGRKNLTRRGSQVTSPVVMVLRNQTRTQAPDAYHPYHLVLDLIDGFVTISAFWYCPCLPSTTGFIPP